MTPLTAALRRQQAALRAQVVLELRRLWPALDPERLDETFPGWFAAAAPVVAQGRSVAAALSGRYVRQVRAASRVSGVAPTGVPRTLPREVLLSSLAVTGPVAIKSSMSRGVPLDRAVESAFVLSANSATRHVLDAGREVVTSSLAQDPRAEGWRRVTSGRACEFCDSLTDIYPPGYGDFPAHDGCACSAEPVYR